MGSERRQVVVLRHGRTSWNEQRRFQGRTDLALDEVGLEQSRMAAQALARFDPSILLTSDSVRARQTAAELAVLTRVEPVPDARLREADIGAWEGLTRAEVENRFPEEYAAWRQGIDIRRGGGEPYADVAKRAVESVTETCARLSSGEALIVVTHGGTAKALIGALLSLPPENWRSVSSLAHGRWAVLEEMPFGWRLDEHNVRPRRRQ